MRCERCGEREAVVHVHQVSGGSTTKLHLCAACAAEQGIVPGESVPATPLGQLVAALGKPGEGGSEAGTATCPDCGATLDDFRAAGRLGCAGCWVAFDEPLRGLLRRLHGATHHRGEQYLASGADRSDAETLTQDLRAQLKAAVAEENFELAAELRDRLQELR
jgi:protein arginine kinase activator